MDGRLGLPRRLHASRPSEFQFNQRPGDPAEFGRTKPARSDGGHAKLSPPLRHQCSGKTKFRKTHSRRRSVLLSRGSSATSFHSPILVWQQSVFFTPLNFFRPSRTVAEIPSSKHTCCASRNTFTNLARFTADGIAVSRQKQFDSIFQKREKSMKKLRAVVLTAVIALGFAGAVQAANAACCPSADCCASCDGC